MKNVKQKNSPEGETRARKRERTNPLPRVRCSLADAQSCSYRPFKGSVLRLSRRYFHKRPQSRATSRTARAPLMRSDHVFGASSQKKKKKEEKKKDEKKKKEKSSLIVFCPICGLLLTSVRLQHFRCQFPKLKKFRAGLPPPPHSQRRLTALPWQPPISEERRRWSTYGTMAAHRLRVPAAPVLIPLLA